MAVPDCDCTAGGAEGPISPAEDGASSEPVVEVEAKRGLRRASLCALSAAKEDAEAILIDVPQMVEREMI